MKEDLLKGLTEEQIAKAKACKTPEELIALAKEEGIELTEEQLEAVNGGACTYEETKELCPVCGSDNVKVGPMVPQQDFRDYDCFNCGAHWCR